MRRDQLEHAIRTACQIIGRREVIVVGSQSILGTFREDQLPAAATRSVEVDILPIADDNDETARLADLIEGVAMLRAGYWRTGSGTRRSPGLPKAGLFHPFCLISTWTGWTSGPRRSSSRDTPGERAGNPIVPGRRWPTR